MFKNLLLTTGLLALLLSSNVSAADTKVTGTVTAQSEYNDKGKSVSDDASVGIALRASNVLVDGLFITGEANSLTVTPLNDARLRTELGLGYARTIGSFQTEASLNRVFNPVIYGDDYSEVRGRVGYSYFFVEASQGITKGVNRDTYVALGAEAQFNPRWTGSAKVSAASYKLGGRTRLTNCGSLAGCEWLPWSESQDTHFNNFEVSTSYNFYGNFDGFLTYSEGGRDYDGSEIKNQFWGGVKYRF